MEHGLGVGCLLELPDFDDVLRALVQQAENFIIDLVDFLAVPLKWFRLFHRVNTKNLETLTLLEVERIGKYLKEKGDWIRIRSEGLFVCGMVELQAGWPPARARSVRGVPLG